MIKSLDIQVCALTLQLTTYFLLCTEISRVRNELFHGVVKNETDGVYNELQLPTPAGPRVKLSEKVFAPVKEYPKVKLMLHWLISYSQTCIKRSPLGNGQLTA